MKKYNYKEQIDIIRFNITKAENNIDTLLKSQDCKLKSLERENINLQRENKELKAKVAYLELNKEGIEQKDDILLNKMKLNNQYGKNSIDREEKKDLIQEIKELEQELKISNKARKQLRTELTRSNRKLKLIKKISDDYIDTYGYRHSFSMYSIHTIVNREK